MEKTYEEAIIIFNEAIEIDEKSYKAYGGLAKTYITRCDENAVNDAHEALIRGYEASTTEDIVNQYLVLSDDLIKDEKEDLAIELLNKGYEIISDDSIKNKLSEVIQNKYSVLLDKIYNLSVENNIDAIKELMKTSEYQAFQAFVPEDIPIYYSPKEIGDNHKKIGVYSVKSKYYSTLIYYGDYDNDVRTGNGIFIGANTDGDNYLFTGTWNNDKPNGYGEVVEWNLGLSENIIKRHKIGNLVDGLWQGEMQWIFIEPNENSIYPINFDNGIVRVIEKNESEEGTYVVSYKVGADEDDNLVFYEENLNKHYGIIGYED